MKGVEIKPQEQNIMVDFTDAAAERVKHALKDNSPGEFGVKVRTDYQTNDAGYGLRYGGGEGAVETATVYFDLTNPMIETDANAVTFINERLSHIGGLKGLVDFHVEKPKDAWAEAAAEFKELQPLVKDQIPANYHNWMNKKVEAAKAGKNDDAWEPHAFSTSRDNETVTGRMTLDPSVSGDEIERMAEAKKPEILNFIERYIDRKRPDLAGQAKNLNIRIKTYKTGDYWNSVEFIFEPKMVGDKSLDEHKKAPGGLEALDDATRHKIKAANVLMALNETNDKSKGVPNELQKVIARAVFQTSPEIAEKAAKTLDFVAAVSKPLIKLKNQPGTSAEVKAKIDKFLSNDLFKDPKDRRAAAEKGVFEPQKLGFDKIEGDPAHYTKGLMTVRLTVPKDKLQLVLQEIADTKVQKSSAVVAPEAAVSAETTTPEITTAGAATVAACPPGEIAVAGAGAAVDDHGHAVAGSGGACVNPQTGEVKAAGAVAAQTPEAQAALAGGVTAALEKAAHKATEAKPVAVGGKVIEPRTGHAHGKSPLTPEVIQGFVKKMQKAESQPSTGVAL